MSINLTEWKTFYNTNVRTRRTNMEIVKDHPLKSLVVTERIPRRILGSQPSTGRTTPVLTPANILEPLSLALKQLDPLTEFAAQELDPLSKMAAERDVLDSKPRVENYRNKKASFDKSVDGMEPWHLKKAAILSKYTTSEKLSIVTSFLSEGEKVVVKAQSTVVDKVQHRLDQLDSFEEGSQRKLDLSQTEYVHRIEQLNRELVLAWNIEQRVKALKIAIQCAKLLADTDVLPFYPSKFVLITDILDVFGKLVYERLRTKAEYYKPGSKVATSLPEDFTPDMVPDSAKETCLNWFYKIASIRELVPRLYVEMALLKSYNFLSSHECPEALSRLTDMIQGIGNPLVAVYARCYLCRVGLNVTSSHSERIFLVRNFTNFLDSYHHIFTRTVRADLDRQKMNLSAYMTLYTPALDFMLETVTCNTNENVLTELLDRCRRYSNSSLILNTIMSGFKPAYISQRTLQFLNMINQCTDDGIPLYSLLRTLGLCVSICPPPAEQRRQVLNTVWKVISGLSDPGQYVACAEVWIQFVAQFFSIREINAILGDIIDHTIPKRSYENLYNELKTIINKVITYVPDFEMLLVMDNFLPLVDLFQQESIRVEVCKSILTMKTNDQTTSDPVITNALMFLCGILHDSVNALTPEDELRQLGDILCNIVRRVDYGKAFEQQLNFYVEARGAFSNIDAVLAQLIQCVNALAVKTRQVVKGLHTRKTGDFVRACAAYCFITIPSIVSTQTRLKLYLLSGEVALFNQCLGQADACFKAALNIIPELRDDTGKSELFLVPYVKQFLSALLVVPDNPDIGVLSLSRMLLNVLAAYEWNRQNGALASLYINVIDLLSTMAQEVYPYHVDKLESNDALYGSDPKFLEEIDIMISKIIEEILILLKELGSCKRQSQIATELFLRVALRADLTSEAMMVLAMKLWNLSLKDGHAESNYLAKLQEYLKSRSVLMENAALKSLEDYVMLTKTNESETAVHDCLSGETPLLGVCILVKTINNVPTSHYPLFLMKIYGYGFKPK